MERTRKICVVAAMDEEILPFKGSGELKKIVKHGSTSDIITAVKIGVGKVNAAISVTRLLSPGGIHKLLYAPEIVILVGTCGAIDPSLQIGDVIVAWDTKQHDVDVTALGFAKGEVPFAPRSRWDAKRELVGKATQAADNLGFRFGIGRILSGDRFIADPDEAQSLRLSDHYAVAVDFETAAVAQACETIGVDWIVIKVVSDTADHSAKHDFAEFTKLAAERCRDMVVEFLKLL